MTVEYKYLHAITARQDTELIDPDTIQFFSSSETHIDAYSVLFSIKHARLDITLDNCIRTAQTVCGDDSEVIQLFKKLFNDVSIPLLDPRGALKTQFVNQMQETAAKYLKQKRTVDELKSFFAQAHGKLNFYNMHSDVIELKDAIDAIESQKYEVIKKYEIKDYNLRQIFRYIYSQEYLLSGTPGSGKTTIYFMIVNDLISQGYNGLHLSYEDNRHITASKIAAVNTGIKKDDIIHRQKTASKQMDVKGQLFIADMPRTGKQTNELIRSYICRYKIDFVSVDFLQLIKNESRQGKVEAIEDFNHMKHEIVMQYNIPFFVISQLTASDVRLVMEGKKEVTAGMEKGGSSSFEYARHAYYFTPRGRINCQEFTEITTEILCGKGPGREGDKWTMKFDGKNGRMLELNDGGIDKKND